MDFFSIAVMNGVAIIGAVASVYGAVSAYKSSDRAKGSEESVKDALNRVISAEDVTQLSQLKSRCSSLASRCGTTSRCEAGSELDFPKHDFSAFLADLAQNRELLDDQSTVDQLMKAPESSQVVAGLLRTLSTVIERALRLERKKSLGIPTGSTIPRQTPERFATTGPPQLHSAPDQK